MRRVSFLHGAAAFGSSVFLLFVCIVYYQAEPQVPLFLCCAVSCLIAAAAGYTWDELMEFMVKAVSKSMEALCILLMIGMLMGVWITAGVVPTMIVYGLQMISAQWLPVSAMLVCAIVSMAAGSWGTAGTVGLAFIGMAKAMGIPAGLAAGAVVSGAYVGDKISPITDTTNLASAVTGTNIFENVFHTARITLPFFAASLLLFGITGSFFHVHAADAAGQDILQVIQYLREHFRISPLSLLPMVVLLVCGIKRVPAIPSIFFSIMLAVLYGSATQHISLRTFLEAAHSGYICESGISLVDSLLTAGGLLSMLNSASIILLAMMFGGILEYTGLVTALLHPFLKHLHNFVSLTVSVLITCTVVNLLLAEQYISIALPGMIYGKEYDRLGIPRRELTAALAVGGASTSALVPWNTCGLFMSDVLNVQTAEYAPYTYFNLLMILGLMAYAGILARKYRTSPSR